MRAIPKSPLRKSALAVAATAAGLLTVSASTAEPLPEVLAAHSGAERTCSGEPCDAVFRGVLRFFDRQPARPRRQRPLVRRLPRGDAITFQLSPAVADFRFRFLQWQRRWNPRADDPLFRPIDADDFRINGENASDFSNLRQNGLVRITFPLPANIKLIDPATNVPSSETFVDVWRMVPSVNDVALTGADGLRIRGRAARTTPAATSSTRVSRRSKSKR